MEKPGGQRPGRADGKKKVLMLASVASMIDQFNLPNIRLMQQLGYEVHAACNFKKGNTCDAGRLRKLWETLENMSVRCHQWDCPREMFPVNQCRKAYRQLRRLFGRHHFAWMHCQSPVGGALARLAAHRAGVPVIYTAHGFHFYKGAPLKNWLLYYPAEKLLARWTNVLVTVNQEDYESAGRNLHAGQVTRIPGVGIDTAYFSGYQTRLSKEAFCRKYRLPEDAFILLSAGELSRRKNHQFVISMLPKLKESVCYLVCGQGKLRGELTGLARKMGVHERVRFAGYVEDLREAYGHADIFVFPSLQEGLPAALLEAMASGVPCFVSDIRGNRELVRFKSGRFASGNRQDFLRGIAELLEDACLREKNRRRVQKQAAAYDIGIVRTEILQIYKSMDSMAGHGADKGQKQ